MKRNQHPKPQSGGLVSICSGLIISFTAIIWILCTDLLFSVERLVILPKSQSFSEIILDLSKVHKEKEKIKSLNYIEANPEVVDNEPEDSRLFSFKNQQAANPTTKDVQAKSNLPKLKGFFDSAKIINEEKNKRKISEKQSKPEPSKVDIQLKEGNKNSESMASKVSIEPNLSNPNGQSSLDSGKMKGNKIIDLRKKDSISKHINTNESRPASLVSKPISSRPKVSPSLINGPLLRSTNSAPRTGTIAVECRLHPYGVYVQQMLQSIEEQWGQLVGGSIQFIRRDKLPEKVSYQFYLTANGKIEQLIRLDKQANSLAADLCRQAISSRVPFGEWNDEMVKDLGQSDLVTIHFTYF